MSGTRYQNWIRSFHKLTLHKNMVAKPNTWRTQFCYCAKGSVVLIPARFLLRTICLMVCDCMFKRYVHARSAGQPPDCQALAETGLAVIRAATLTAPN